jgi:hypothetical protein
VAVAPVSPFDAQHVANAWVEAWEGDDAAAVLALLHDDATIADPIAGKVRADAIPAHVAGVLAGERSAVVDWHAHSGADSVAVVVRRADGSESVDVLVLSDGKIVRAMRHR